MSNEDLFTNEELESLKEQLKKEICSKRGWDKNNLNSEQLFEIYNSKEYKNLGLIKS